MNETSLLRAHALISARMADRRLHRPLTLAFVDDVHKRLVVGVPKLDPAAARDCRRLVRALAGDVPLTVVPFAAERHANKRDYNRPLTGGLYIACPSVAGEGTICIGASRGGVEGFVTAGHVVEQAGTEVYQPRKSTTAPDQWLVGTAAVVSNYGGTALSDSAFIAGAAAPITSHAIWRSSSRVYMAIGIYDAPAPGTPVSMMGASTQTAERGGIIAGKNVTVTFVDGGTLQNQLLANYQSTTGDSGAPVYFKLNEELVLLVGLNVGAAQPQYCDPTPDPSIYPTAPNGTYAVISPWSNVEQDLGLSAGLPQQTP